MQGRAPGWCVWGGGACCAWYGTAPLHAPAEHAVRRATWCKAARGLDQGGVWACLQVCCVALPSMLCPLWSCRPAGPAS